MNETMEKKPAFPDVAPVIEVFPGIHATLISDFSRYSSGSFPLGGHYMKVHQGGKQVGEIGANGGGEWIVCIEGATYFVNMAEAYAAAEKAHIESL